jgi:EAL domain-containing protein (putative c-di-GMP-specific phosphodiesterase class I)
MQPNGTRPVSRSDASDRSRAIAAVPDDAVVSSALVTRALDRDNLYAAYQPIVDLDGGAVVAYEALARWRDADLAPGVVFPAANETGQLADLDWACRVAALEGALGAGMARGQTLFVNVEPSTFGTKVPDTAAALIVRATTELRIMIELTERALLRNPREVLRIVNWAREHGLGIALDDVGADPDSLTILPFVAPDVIKLDISLIQHQPGAEQGRIMAAVLAHAEATGATILAEGIETAAHLEQAQALGATLGQGWYFGHPGSLPTGAPAVAPLAISAPALPAPTPFSLVAHSDRKRVGRKNLLLGMSRHIESLGDKDGDLVVLAAFQTADRFTPATRRRYERLGRHCPLVGALGVGMPSAPAHGVRGADLAPDDDLAGEWTVVVVGPHYAGALIAKDCGDSGPEGDRRFEFVVTHERAVVLDAARSLMARLVPLG